MRSLIQAPRRFIASLPITAAFILLLALPVWAQTSGGGGYYGGSGGSSSGGGSWSQSTPTYAFSQTPTGAGWNSSPPDGYSRSESNTTVVYDGTLAGTVSITFTWNGGANNEPAPPSVIVTETMKPAVISYSGSTSTATPTTNTGLTGNVATRYEVKTVSNGSFLVMSPTMSASVSGAQGNARLSIGMTASASNVSVSLTGATTDNNTLKVLTGQQINLSLVSSPGVKIDASGKPMIQWTVSGGGVFKDYDPFAPGGQDRCHVQYHTAEDWKQPSPGFFTKSAGAVSVSCVATLDFPADAVVVAPLPEVNVTARALTSMKPTVTRWDIESGFTQDDRNSAGLVTKFGLLAVPSVPEGQYWTDVMINVQAPFSGGIGCFAQIITPNRRADRTPPPGSTASPYYEKVNNGFPGLDVAFPYPVIATGSQGGYTWNVPSVNTPAGDSPKQGVTPSDVDGGGTAWYQVVAGDTMTTWVMYRPVSKDGQPTAYVPLMNYSWGWSGTMKKDPSGVWQFVSHSPQNATQSPITQAKAATDNHPEWDRQHEYGFILLPPQ